MTSFLSFHRRIPPPLLFIQTTHQQIHMVMDLLIWVVCRTLTIWTLALMDRLGGHRSLAFSAS